MMTNFEDKPSLVLDYDLDYWNTYGEKKPISVDLSPQTNSHILICGMSGSGKSYLEQAVLAKFSLAQPEGEIYFADYKGEDCFTHLRECPRYYSYWDTLQALDAVAFPAGSRLNYGVVVVLGAAIRSIYEMLLPDHMEQVKGRQFRRGEGVVLLQGSELRCIKVPVIGNIRRMEEICQKALGGQK